MLSSFKCRHLTSNHHLPLWAAAVGWASCICNINHSLSPSARIPVCVVATGCSCNSHRELSGAEAYGSHCETG